MLQKGALAEYSHVEMMLCALPQYRRVKGEIKRQLNATDP
jgi:hypothetical protein